MFRDNLATKYDLCVYILIASYVFMSSHSKFGNYVYHCQQRHVSYTGDHYHHCSSWRHKQLLQTLSPRDFLWWQSESHHVHLSGKLFSVLFFVLRLYVGLFNCTFQLHNLCSVHWLGYFWMINRRECARIRSKPILSYLKIYLEHEGKPRNISGWLQIDYRIWDLPSIKQEYHQLEEEVVSLCV